MGTALAKTGKRLDSLFAAVDLNQDNMVDRKEFSAMFERMKIKLTENELANLFLSIDFDMSGDISYPELSADFEKTLKTNIQTLLQHEKDRFDSESIKTSARLEEPIRGAISEP